MTVIRAGIIVGHGGISWELTRQLVEHLPAMITPRWVATRTQPIAVDDVVRYLLGVLARPEAAGRVFEAGGPEVLQYVTMLRRVAAIQGRPLPILPVPLLTPRLSARRSPTGNSSNPSSFRTRRGVVTTADQPRVQAGCQACADHVETPPRPRMPPGG